MKIFFLGREIGLNLSKSHFIAFLTFYRNIRGIATISLLKLSNLSTSRQNNEKQATQ